MKRNNIFMWAYILFIAISVVMRTFDEFSLWNPIVLAITTSSIFFALEDLFASLYQSLKEFINILDGFLSEAGENYNENMELVAKIDEKFFTLKSLQYDSTNTISSFEKVKNKLHELDLKFSMNKQENAKRKIKLKKYEKAVIFSAYIGFLCLFCVLIVATKLTISNMTQEILTVITFAMILATHQLNDIWLEKNKKTSDKSKIILADYALIGKDLEDAKKKLDELVVQITDEEQKQKEEHNAN